MAVESLVIGLSGEEIIADLLDQIEKALRRDCNLRATDSYGGGYSGKIEIKLNLVAMDTTVLTITKELAPTEDAKKVLAEKEASGELPVELPATGVFQVAQEMKPVEASATIDIPIEKDLNAVRERSGQGVPMESISPEGKHDVKRRRYARVTGGGVSTEEAGE
ncbi:MAG TPA: hypothetical protein VFW94_23365 [Candidatus Acidoferrales bacterium]|nr:hypothetical protein [Candidatus Acidoferrales bacterium]